MNITDHASFKANVLPSPVPALLCFHSPWNAYCRRTVATLRELSEGELLHLMNFYYVDVDEVPLAVDWLDFPITGIPTIVVFRQGKYVSHFVGETSRKNRLAQLKNLLEQL